jgi:hypothetical protein
MADLLAAALEYAAAGVYVFPARVGVVEGRKQVQPVGSWRDASSRSPEVIHGWFAPGQRWADASVCIDLGKSGLVVVDLDEGEGKSGLSTWAALVAEHEIPVTLAHARTPSGGEHWYYREHSRRPVGNDSTGKVAHGVDVRGLGGFVIAWPSEDARGAYGRVDLEALAAAPVVPDFVIEAMTAKTPLAAEVPEDRAPVDEFWASVAPRREFTVDQARAFVGPPLETFRALRTPEDSGFNAKLNALACVWSHFVPEFMSADQAERTLYAAAVHNLSVQWQGEPGVRATIRSGLGQHGDPWRAVRVEDGADGEESAPERPLRRGNFTGIRDRKRAEPEFIRRADGRALLYPGKDTYLYAETESGKSWLAALAIVQCLTDEVPIIVYDFEEGDELEYGNRLLDLGMTEEKINDPSLFRYMMVDGKCTEEILAEALDMGARVVINEGMSVAYDLYGWQVKENDSATAFRRTLVKPHLVLGRSVLTTDHVVKDKDSRGRYAIGGVMKLNAASGGAFLLVNVEGLSPGRRGASNLYVTKDRPGGVKRHGVSAGEKFDPQVRRVGTLVVDDSRTFVNFLKVEILPPAVEDLNAPAALTLAEMVLAAIDELKSAGHVPTVRSVRAAVDARGTEVDGELDRLLIRGLVTQRHGERGARVFDRVPDLEEEE